MTTMQSAIEARGSTAVLGVRPRTVYVGTSYSSPTHPSPLGSGVSATGSTYQPSLSGSGHVAGNHGKASARSIGKRKQRRSENARLSSNPHVTRPSARDYSLSHPNSRSPTFPLPAHLSRLTATPSAIPKTTVNTEANGRFNLRLSDASFFLNHRVGVRIDPRVPPKAVEESLTPPQRCVRVAEAEIRGWMGQVVFRGGSGIGDGSLDENVLFDGEDGQPVLTEEARHPHSLVWVIPDPYMRLAIHCLARVLGCPSFSKDGPSSVRRTWILHPRPPVSATRRPAGASGIDTPPTTDVGTDLGSETSDWAGLTTEESELSDAEGYILADALSDYGEDDTTAQDIDIGDTTMREDTGIGRRGALRALDDVQEVDSEADADIEDD